MIITAHEINSFSKEAASKFLKDNRPLSQSIAEIAKQHGLNREQINRIVEATNAETYTSLFNKSDNRYVNFEHADSNDVTASASFTAQKVGSDILPTEYVERPPAGTSPEILAQKAASINLFPTTEPELVKQAEVPFSLYDDYTKIARVSASCMEELNLLEREFSTKVASLYDMVKEAVLQGDIYNDLSKAACAVYPEPLLVKVFDIVQTQLKAELPLSKHAQLTKTSLEKRQVNCEHPFIKLAERIVMCGTETIKLLEKQEALATEWDNLKKEAVAGAPEAGKVSKILSALKTPIEHPVLTGSMFVGGVAVATAGHAASEHNKHIVNESPLNTIPGHYQR